MTDLLFGDRQPVHGPDMEAATVVLLRPAASGPECLMLRKNPGQAFGGMWVFPGGRVEEGEGEGLAGARRAAVREVAEETGLRVEPDELVPMSHWAPPRTAPRRYRTWFFVARLADGAPEVMVDGGEIGDHVWTTPGEALAVHDRGDIRLLPPTWVTLRRLVGYSDVAGGLRDCAARPIERFSTRMVTADDVPVALWSPDAAYPVGDADEPLPLDTPGPRHRLYMDSAGWRYERSDHV